MANSAPARFMSKVPTRAVGVWQGTITAAEITAGKTVVPAVGGMQFVCKDLMMRGQGGTCSGPTTITFMESASSGVVVSHVSADLSAAVWNYTTGGTVVTTNWKLPLTISEGIKCIAVGGSANTAMTTMDYIIEGYYIPATGKQGNAL